MTILHDLHVTVCVCSEGSTLFHIISLSKGWGYTHDRRADKYPYPHDRRADRILIRTTGMWLMIGVALLNFVLHLCIYYG